MEYRENTSKFLEMVIELNKLYILPSMNDKQNKEFGEALRNSILGKPQKPIEHNSSPIEYFAANNLFRPLSEILSSIESIENIGIYSKSFPFKRQGISQYSYLRYHIENYLNELYLLQNRLTAYLAKIEKAYRKSEISDYVLSITIPLRTVVTNSLKTYTEARGYHVHEYRYSDNDLDWLSTLELFSKTGDDFGKIMQEFFIKAHKDVRKTWVGRINDGINGVHTLLEYFFQQLISAISKDGEILVPNNLQKSLTRKN
jgi:hypothetical protein